MGLTTQKGCNLNCAVNDANYNSNPMSTTRESQVKRGESIAIEDINGDEIIANFNLTEIYHLFLEQEFGKKLTDVKVNYLDNDFERVKKTLYQAQALTISSLLQSDKDRCLNEKSRQKFLQNIQESPPTNPSPFQNTNLSIYLTPSPNHTMLTVQDVHDKTSDANETMQPEDLVLDQVPIEGDNEVPEDKDKVLITGYFSIEEIKDDMKNQSMENESLNEAPSFSVKQAYHAKTELRKVEYEDDHQSMFKDEQEAPETTKFPLFFTQKRKVEQDSDNDEQDDRYFEIVDEHETSANKFQFGRFFNIKDGKSKPDTKFHLQKTAKTVAHFNVQQMFDDDQQVTDRVLSPLFEIQESIEPSASDTSHKDSKIPKKFESPLVSPIESPLESPNCSFAETVKKLRDFEKQTLSTSNETPIQMSLVNQCYAVVSSGLNGTNEQICDWDCIILSIEEQKFGNQSFNIDAPEFTPKKNQPQQTVITLPFSQLQIQLPSLKVVGKKSQGCNLIKLNEKYKMRPKNSLMKESISIFGQTIQQYKSNKFQNKNDKLLTQFGRKWAKQYKGRMEKMPSYLEVMEGLRKWFCSKINSQTKHEHQISNTLMTFNEAFVIMTNLQLPKEDCLKPLLWDCSPESDSYWNQMNLANPNSQVSCLILFLYSMESDDKPLFEVINKVCKSDDLKELATLGPFIHCLSWVIQGRMISVSDHATNIRTGDTLGGVISNMAGSFLVFKGGIFEKSLVKEWESQAKTLNKINLPSLISCTENIHFALEEAFLNQKSYYMEPVLFVIGLQNYDGFSGVRLNTNTTTAYLNEQEVLLRDGCSVHVLGVQNIQKVRNSKYFAGNKPSSIKVIHLVHQM